MHKNWRMKLQYIYMMFGAGNNQQVITRIKKTKNKTDTIAVFAWRSVYCCGLFQGHNLEDKLW